MLRQGCRQFLLCRNCHLQLPLHALASLGQLWLDSGLQWACQFMGACTPPSKKQNAMQYAKPNTGYGQGSLSPVSWNLLADLICS